MPSCGLQNPIEPFHDGDGWVEIMTPMPSVTLFQPALLRAWGHCPDFSGPNNYCARVDFYVDGALRSMQPSQSLHGDYFQADISGIAAGCHVLYAVGILGNGTVVESTHIPFTVLPDPSLTRPAADIITLTADVTGSAPLTIVGTPTARKLIVGNGFAYNVTGPVNVQNVDVVGVGTSTKPWLTVTTSSTAGVVINGVNADRSGQTVITANGTAPITFTNTTIEPNTLIRANDTAGTDFTGNQSQPSIVFAGNSTAAKVFSGNNVGIGFVKYDHSNNWTVGGSSSAAGNIFLGVRTGNEFDAISGLVFRGNFSYHRYPYGWSQGLNLAFEGAPTNVLVEHNVFREGSWMIEQFKGELRYNALVDNINEAFFRSPVASLIHHNIFTDVGYTRQYSPTAGILNGGSSSFYNNTIDMGGPFRIWTESASFITGSSAMTKVRNNVIVGFSYDNPTPIAGAGTLAAGAADYNAFYNPDTIVLTKYAQSGMGAHDLPFNTNPMFSGSRVVPFGVSDADIWQRRSPGTVAQLLLDLANRYRPGTGSPLIDAGNPADGAGTDMGAIGAGVATPLDLFEAFGP